MGARTFGCAKGQIGRGLTFSEVVEAVNAKFKTAYSRNAAIGRARRMGLAGADRPKESLPAQPPRLDGVFEVRSAKSVLSELHWPRPVFERVERPEAALCRDRAAPSIADRT